MRRGFLFGLVANVLLTAALVAGTTSAPTAQGGVIATGWSSGDTDFGGGPVMPGAAWASFDEQRTGTLERDMLADIVILSTDLFALPSDRLLEAEVVMTIVDGKIVYPRDPPETEH